jgi:sterol desaturase/sphingolipid hydroxylase (fatty acid hydroxylase superfamily)
VCITLRLEEPAVPPTIQGLLIGFVVLFVAFRLLELLRPVERRLPILRRGFWTDLVYWAFTPLATRAITRFCVIVAIVPLALLIYGRVDKELLLNGFGPASRLPLWLQAILILLIGDFIGYWMHRAFHRGRLWRFHAVHHSSVDLDWLSAVRLHPVNDALMRIAGTLPVLALGFAPVAVAGIAPFLTLMAILVHANLDWDWGPLRWLVVSPRFHRWHHTDEANARDRNFAGLLPLWDTLFGTYHMPRGELPQQFGTATPVPARLLGQMLFPFRRSSGA